MRQLFKILSIVGLFVFIGALTLVPASPSEAQTGVTWTGSFYPSTNFTGSSAIASYPGGLNQNWGTGPPTAPLTGQVPGIPADNFSVRFATNTTIAAGVYEFIVLADGGVRLSVNGEAVIDDLGGMGLSERGAIVNITGGSYVLVLEYVEYTGNALIQINWIPSTGTPTVGEETAIPAALVTVVQVQGLAVRTGPFLGGSLVAVARPGGDYPVIARNTQEGLFTWYLIQYDADTQGWSSGRYLSFSQGAPENVPLQNTTDFDTIYDPPGTVIGVTRSVMNFRQFPTQRAARIPQVPQLFWGAEVEILARTVQGGNNFWYQVRYTPENSSTSYVGWIFAPYVGIKFGSDPLDTVPII